MELSHLRYFCRVAETSSFTRGARLAHVSPPAMTKAIRKLEEEVGARLFERSTRRVVLTDAGAAVWRRAKGVLAEADGIQRDVDDQRTGVAGELRVGAMEVFSIRLLPRALAALVAEHPAVVVVAYEMHPEALARHVAEGELDVGLSIGPAGARYARALTTKLLGASPACVVCGRGHPLFAGARIAPSDLERHPFAAPRFFGREDAPSLDQFPDERYPRRIGATFELLQMGVELALSGRFLACFPRATVEHHLRTGDLRALAGLRLPRFELQAWTRGAFAPKRSAAALVARLEALVRAPRRARAPRSPSGAPRGGAS